ncbi:MAG: ketopantoate reductase family protein [Anaerolineae bacterium]
MRILIMGTGGMGGYYGALLAKQDHEVTFVARGKHLAAIRKEGLRIHSIHGDVTISPAHATDDPSTTETPDLILFCTKTYATDRAAELVKPVVRQGTTILSLQNGIDAPERIGKVVGMQHMLGGATWISSAVQAPGVINQVSDFRRVVIGELDRQITPRLKAVHQAFQETGIAAELSDNILKVLWTKFIFISAASSFGSLTRLPMAQYRAVPDTRELIVALMREVEALGRKQAVELDADVVDQALRFMDNAGPSIKASMQLDVESGHRTEIESMLGVIGRKGRESRVETPVADTLYALLLPVDLSARGRS